MHKYTKICKTAMSFLESARSDASIYVNKMNKNYQNMNSRALVINAIFLFRLNRDKSPYQEVCRCCWIRCCALWGLCCA